MDENLYRIGSGELVYYHMYDEDGEYYGYFMLHTEDFLEMLIDDFLDELSEKN